jgi:ABC-2 type transport system permease protein
MTAVTTTPAVTAAEPRARFRDLGAAEWLKFWSLRSTPWSFVISALVILGLNAGAAYEHVHYWHANRFAPATFIADGLPLLDAFTSNAAIAMIVAAGAIGTLAVTGEYGTGLIRTTFSAVPARRSVMAAKVSVIAAVTTGFGAVVAVASFGLTQAILSGQHAGVSLGHPGAWRVVVASALLAPLSALVGAAVGAIVRHSAAAVGTTIVILQAVPLLIHDNSHLPAVIAHALPFQAWNRLTAIPFNPVAHAYPWTITGAWTVFAVWGLVAAVLAVAAVQRRDV